MTSSPPLSGDTNRINLKGTQRRQTLTHKHTNAHDKQDTAAGPRSVARVYIISPPQQRKHKYRMFADGRAHIIYGVYMYRKCDAVIFYSQYNNSLYAVMALLTVIRALNAARDTVMCCVFFRLFLRILVMRLFSFASLPRMYVCLLTLFHVMCAISIGKTNYCCSACVHSRNS